MRNSLTSPAGIQHVVRMAKPHGINALFVQVRGRGDAFYQSNLEPRAEELSGQLSAFDPLAEVIRQGHAAGVQIHARLNTCFVWGPDEGATASGTSSTSTQSGWHGMPMATSC